MSVVREKCVDHVLDLRTDIKAVETDGRRRIFGIATTPSVDRMGDIVLPLGAQYKLPLPLLWQHRADQPIGNVVAAKVTANGIEVEAELLPGGQHDAIDRHWVELKGGLVRFLSIGFREIQSRAGTTGKIFTRWEWLELSAVTIAANGEAGITAVKAFSVPERIAAPRTDYRTAGLPVVNLPPGIKKMTIAEKIAARKTALAANRAQLSIELDADSIDEQRSADIERLNAEIEADQNELASLERSERNIAVAAAGAPAQPTAIARAAPVAGVPAVRPAPIVVRGNQNAVKGDLVIKSATAITLAHIQRKPLEEVLRERYAGNTDLDMYIRAATAPAMTTVPGWAQELVQTTTLDYLDSLVAESLYAALATKGLRFTFGRAGKIIIPARAAGSYGQLAGDWVAEGAPIPVKQGTIGGITLAPTKLAVISTFTRELAMQSTPQIETLLRQLIREDTAGALDKFLFDNVAASATRPAGLLFGVTPTASSGTTAANIATDLKVLLTKIISANGGRQLVWVMNPVHGVGLSMLQSATGDFIFQGEVAAGRLLGYPLVTSINMPIGTVVLMDLADFASATGDVPAYDVSDVATLHMDGDVASVSPIVDGTGSVAQPVRSLWQTASIGIRMIQDVSWGMRRPGMVAALSGVAW